MVITFNVLSPKISDASSQSDELNITQTSVEDSVSEPVNNDTNINAPDTNTSHESDSTNNEETHTQSSSPISALTGTFGINSKLFLGQLINFGIVLLLFWKFMVKPLGKLMTERSEKIAKGLKLAESMSAEKEELVNLENKTKADLIKLKKQIVADAEAEAKQIINDAYQKASAESQALIYDANQQIQNQKQALEKELKQMTYDVASSIATKVLDREVRLSNNDPLINKNV